MHFCTNCHNMYYLKIREEDGGNTLNYYCRNCGHEDTNLTAESICVSETQLRRSEQKYTHMINEYTKFDPTLPRINTIKCPNQECISNGFAGGVNVNKHDLSTAAPHLGMDGGNKKGGNNEEDGTSATAGYDGGAGKKTTDAATAASETSKTKKKLVLTKNKTAKTLAKEAAESAKEAIESTKQAETIVKELIAEEEQEEAEEVAAETKMKSKKQTTKEKKENEREVIYIRYDDINMKYVYLCVHCDTTWKTDNRT
jgi:DNA-directed RNA polymerase subunit M/transcription elongation factor TFIIS